MIFHENRLLAILMKYHTLFFFQKLGKMSQNLSSAAVVIGALRVNSSSPSQTDEKSQNHGQHCLVVQ